MPWWDALNRGMTGIPTGVFSITGNSLSGYSSPIQSAAIAIMVLRAISFALCDREIGIIGIIGWHYPSRLACAWKTSSNFADVVRTSRSYDRTGAIDLCHSAL